MMEQAVFAETNNGFPVLDEEAIQIYNDILQKTDEQDLLSDNQILSISRQIYSDPENPEASQQTHLLSDAIVEGVTNAWGNLDFGVRWVDDYFDFFEVSNLDFSEQSGALLILGNLNPLKTGNLSVFSSMYFVDQPSQNLVIQLENNNGNWEIINFEMPKTEHPNTSTENDEVRSAHLSFDEMATIYSAAFLQAYTIDNLIPGTEISELYILQNTGLAVNSISLPLEVQEGINQALGTHPFEITWVEERSEKLIESQEAILTLGYILPHNEDGAVEVLIELQLSEFKGILVTYILQNIDGEWQITEFGGMG